MGNYYAAGLVDQKQLLEFGMEDDFEYCYKWRPDQSEIVQLHIALKQTKDPERLEEIHYRLFRHYKDSEQTDIADKHFIAMCKRLFVEIKEIDHRRKNFYKTPSFYKQLQKVSIDVDFDDAPLEEVFDFVKKHGNITKSFYLPEPEYQFSLNGSKYRLSLKSPKMPLGYLFVLACDLNNLDFNEKEYSLHLFPAGSKRLKLYSINNKYWFDNKYWSENSHRSVTRRVSLLIKLEQDEIMAYNYRKEYLIASCAYPKFEKVEAALKFLDELHGKYSKL